MGKPRSPLREHELRALGAYAHTCVKSGKAAMNDVCVCDSVLCTKTTFKNCCASLD